MTTSEGLTDLTWVYAAAYRSIEPTANFIGFSELSVEEEEARGVYDLIRKYSAEVGLYFLGRGNAFVPLSMQYLHVNKRIERPQDLAGLSVGVSFGSLNFLKALGMTLIQMTDEEMYSGLERGLVDAYTNPWYEIRTFGLHEVTKYTIDHGFKGSTGVLILNLETWNGLPKHLQDLITKTHKDHEKGWLENDARIKREERQALLDYGLEFIKFSPDDAEWYVNLALESEWPSFLKNYPDKAPQFKELLSK